MNLRILLSESKSVMQIAAKLRSFLGGTSGVVNPLSPFWPSSQPPLVYGFSGQMGLWAARRGHEPLRASILALALIAFAIPAFAATPTPTPRPKLTTAQAPLATDPLSALMSKLDSVGADVVAGAIGDIQAADADAATTDPTTADPSFCRRIAGAAGS